MQEKSEKYLNNRLNQFEIWENRPTIRGKIFTNMYIFRNTILGINAQTKRSMIPKKYAENLSAFTAFLNFAKNKQIEPIIYIPPIRGDVDIPYVKSEYQQLKNDLDRIVVEIDDSNRIYIFDNIVPGELWGYKAATNWFGDEELDFMHFQFEGHKILYKTFLNEFFVKE